jgi:uncharacterized protein YprB with RNaseH-like and TPR domain
MLDSIQIHNILFIDIETVPVYPTYDDLPDLYKRLWDTKSERIRQHTEDTSDRLYEKAGIYSEFGKVICISAGFYKNQEFRIKSFYGDDEKVILNGFAGLLSQYFNKEEHFLCAHNGKEFDFPYLSRRMVVQGIRLPVLLDLAGKKPWEVKHLDTMELWKFGDHKNYTSLELLATLLGIPTPKDDIRGADIAGVYWKDHDLDRIVAYCQKDATAVAQIFLRFQGKPLIRPDQIVVIK